MKKIETHLASYPSTSISDPHQLPVAPLFLMHFLRKFSIYVRHKFNAVW